MIDIQSAEGQILSLSEKPKEPEAGQKMQLATTMKLALRGSPEMLDQFLDLTQFTGLKPSEAFWAKGKGDDGKNRFVRWLGITGVEFILDTQSEYMVKISSIPLEGESPAEVAKTKIEVALPVKLTGKGWATASANQNTVEVSTLSSQTDEQHQQLRDLFKRGKVTISLYNRQEDLVQAPHTPPRPGSEGKPAANVTPISAGKGSKGVRGRGKDKGPASEPSGADDALFPDVVEHVVKTRRATVPDLQQHFKLPEARATDLMAALYSLEVVGPADPDGNHEVRWTEKDLKDTKNGGADAIPPGGAASQDIE